MSTQTRTDIGEMNGEQIARFFETAGLPGKPETFQAQRGRRPTFLSQGDADAFDAGYNAFDGDLNKAPPFGTPYARGWSDAYYEDEQIAMAAITRHECADVGCEFDEVLR